MASSGQKRGSCGHIMAVFDGDKKYAQCGEKGVGERALAFLNPARIVTSLNTRRICLLPQHPKYVKKRNLAF